MRQLSRHIAKAPHGHDGSQDSSKSPQRIRRVEGNATKSSERYPTQLVNSQHDARCARPQELARVKNLPLRMCFIDLQKAWNSVGHPLL